MSSLMPILATSQIHPVLPASDLSRAQQFYGEVLGLQIEKPDESVGQFMARTGEGSWVLVYETTAPRGGATAATFIVKDLPHVVNDLRAQGVNFQEYDQPGLKTVNGIAEMPGERSAWFEDSEGNIIAIGEMVQ